VALSQTAVAIVCHATRRVAQNQPEQMFERPHVIEDPVRCGFLRAIVKQFDGLVPFELSRRDDGNGDHGTNRLQRSDHKSLITFYQSPSFNPAHSTHPSHASGRNVCGANYKKSGWPRDLAEESCTPFQR